MNKIYLTGYTPAPVDRFGRVNKKLIKASLGAEEFAKWEMVINFSNLLKKLKKENYKLLALEQDSKSVNYKKVKFANKMAIIVGNEVRGLEKSILNKVDIIAEIPMRGRKESLNVSVAFGIFVFNLFKH